MSFDKSIFENLPIGKKDKNGIDLYCNDFVEITEEIYNYDYSNPVLNFDTNTFSFREIKSLRKVKGQIIYSTKFSAFCFIPFADINYVRKMIYCFEENQIEKI